MAIFHSLTPWREGARFWATYVLLMENSRLHDEQIEHRELGLICWSTWAGSFLWILVPTPPVMDCDEHNFAPVANRFCHFVL